MSEPFHGVGLELGDAGPAPVVTYRKKSWKVGFPTQKAKAELEGLTIIAARRNLAQSKPYFDAESYKREEEMLRAAIQGGYWKTWGSLWQSVNSGPDSNTLFLLSLLKQNHPEATWEDAEGMWAEEAEQVKDAMAQVIPSFYAILVKAMPGTPENRAEILAKSVAEFLTAINRLPSLPTASNNPTTSSDSTPSATETGKSPT